MCRLLFTCDRSFMCNNVYHIPPMAKVKVEELGTIWGKEVNEIRALSVQAVKLKYPIKGYDLMLKNQEKHAKK